MKKLTFWFGIGALALASCSNDEMVMNTNYEETADASIGFSVSTGNMSRAGEATQLSKEHWDFGVWAYKGTTGPTTAVMENYMVGFWDKTNNQGYNPTNSQQILGSKYETEGYAWYYETLGKLQQTVTWTDTEGVSGSKGFDFLNGGTSRVASTSEVDYQYLKYWDKSANMKTRFYAYAPYSINGNEAAKKVKLEDGTEANTKKMTFPVISSITDDGQSAMYAGESVTNPNGKDNKYVNLTFKRLLAQVRMAFYEVVEGYSVELVDYSADVSIPDDDRWSGFGTKAMYAVPATEVSEGNFEAGEYVTSAQPIVTFADNMTATVSYGSQTTTGTNINIPLWFFSGDTQTNVLGTTKEAAIMNDVKNVLPSGDTYCGFTINLSLKFTALDTGEEILVKGVKVHIPKEDCQWLANHRYTYYFKVTKNVPGTPGEPGEPGIEPGEEPYLLPIVFDNVTVEDIKDAVGEEGQYNYDINKED